MAALGWLLNLDFAGGGGADPVIPGGVSMTAGVPSKRYGYGYGYRHFRRFRWTWA